MLSFVHKEIRNCQKLISFYIIYMFHFFLVNFWQIVNARTRENFKYHCNEFQIFKIYFRFHKLFSSRMKPYTLLSTFISFTYHAAKEAKLTHKSETKWPPFCRPRFSNAIFLYTNCCSLIQISLKGFILQ